MQGEDQTPNQEAESGFARIEPSRNISIGPSSFGERFLNKLEMPILDEAATQGGDRLVSDQISACGRVGRQKSSPAEFRLTTPSTQTDRSRVMGIDLRSMLEGTRPFLHRDVAATRAHLRISTSLQSTGDLRHRRALPKTVANVHKSSSTEYMAG